MFMAEVGEPLWVPTGDNQLDYNILYDKIPKQVESLDARATLEKNTNAFSSAVFATFIGPLALHLFGFGSMDIVWLI